MNPENTSNRQKGMTRFICQELLYEFVTGRLDSERQRNVDEYLTDCRDSQREFERMRRGLKYTSQAADIRVSEDLLKALNEFEPAWKKTLAQWTLQSAQRGWKFIPYIFLVLLFTLGLFVFKPWKARLSTDVMLAEQIKEPAKIETAPAPAPTLPPASTLSPVSTTTPAGNSLEAESVPSAAAVAPVAAASPVAAVAPVPAKKSIARAELQLQNFDSEWPVIRAKIVDLGGKVADSVEPTSASPLVYQFSLPLVKRAELERFLKTFGPVRFHSEPDPGVMPEGEIRFILRVQDAIKDTKPDEEAEKNSPETP